MGPRITWRRLNRREIYRETKRRLRRVLAPHWNGARSHLDSALRALLRSRTIAQLLYLARRPGTAAAIVFGAAFLPTATIAADAIQLSDIAADNNLGGFLIDGVAGFAFTGASVAGAGDVNGDGLSDLVIGATSRTVNRPYSGAVYVIFGKNGGQSVDLNSVEAGTGAGFVIFGSANYDGIGTSVAIAGDLNQDGLADILIGAPNADPNGSTSGSAYVVFGKTNTTPVDLADVEAGTGGFAMHGAAEKDRAGTSCAGLGDIDGDGRDDIVVGAYGADPNGSYSGTTYVVFGKSSGTPLELANVAMDDDATGFAIFGGAAGDRSGVSVSIVGDMNQDGLDDLVVGAPYANTIDGAAYVVFGKAGGASVQLSDVAMDANNNGFAIFTDADNVRAGYSVSGAGDVDGDGRVDVIVGAKFEDYAAGKSYVIFGRTTGTSVNASALADENNTTGFAIHGANSTDQSGFSVSGAGDVNGDGLTDLIVGAKFASTTEMYCGKSYVVFGKSGGAPVNLSDVELSGNAAGIALIGVAAGDQVGGSVSNAGDVNGDGNDDILIGAPGADPNGGYSGAAYVVFSTAPRTTVWVDFARVGFENGWVNAPYNTLAEGVTAVPSGGTINIVGSSAITTSPTPTTLSKAMTIQAIGGTIRIGAP